MLVSQCHSNFDAPLIRESQTKATGREQKNTAKFAIHTNDSFWKIVVRNCVFSKHAQENRHGNL